MVLIDQHRVATWRTRYERAHMAYINNMLPLTMALDELRALRFRDEALRIEINEWQRERHQRLREELSATRKILGSFDAPTVTAPSSL